MTYLLDTCAAIWLMAGDKLSDLALRKIEESADNNIPILVSPVTAWEVGMLSSKGRLPLSHGPLSWYEDLIGLSQILETELSPKIMIGSSFLGSSVPLDPFDRMIIATARNQDATIITRDRKIIAFAEMGNCKVLEC